MAETGTGRLARRKEQTRGALLRAAQGFLAEGTSAVSIQEITDAADVGFGSFYNHFTSKDELFAEAVATALEEWAQLRDAAVADIVDPVERFAVSFRLAGRIEHDQPEMVRVVRVILNAGTQVLRHDRGLRPRALADIGADIEAGRFDVPDPEWGLMLVGGSLMALLELLASDPDVEDGPVSDWFAERLLLALGIEAEEAHRICTGPLPQM